MPCRLTSLPFMQRHFGLHVNMQRRCPIRMMKRMALYSVLAACLCWAAITAHPSHEQIAMAYREAYGRQAIQQASEWLARQTKPHSDELRKICGAPHSQMFDSYCTKEQTK